MATKKPSIVDLMYRDFLRLAGEEVSHAKPVKKKPVVKSVVQKKKPVVKIVLNKTRVAPKVPIKKGVFKRTLKKKFVPMKPRRSTIDYPIGGVAQLLHPDERIPEAPDRGDTPVSSHWRHFDRDTGRPVAPWEVMMGPEYDDDDDVDDDSDPWDGMFRDEDYSYEDFETDWGGYDHQDTGYDDENA